MSKNLGNKEIMSANIRRLMEERDLNMTELAKALGQKYTTVVDWVNGVNYPRIDKIELLANYFGVSKSDLVEPYTSLDPVDCPPEEVSYVREDGTVYYVNRWLLRLKGLDEYDNPILVSGDYERPTNVDCDYYIVVDGLINAGGRINLGDTLFIKEQSILPPGALGIIALERRILVRYVHVTSNGAVLLSPIDTASAPELVEGDKLKHLKILGRAVASLTLL